MMIMRSIRRGIAAFACLAAVGAAGAQSAESLPSTTDLTEARLITEGSAVPGGTVWAALLLDHAPKWHSYWRNPGDSGLPTTIEWRLPEGWSAGEIVWPAPHRIPTGPFVNYGFDGEVLLPVPLGVPADAVPGSTARIEASAQWLVCADICIPEEAKLALDVAVSGPPAAADGAWAGRFAKARQHAPKPSPWSAVVDGGADTLLLRIGVAGLERDRLGEITFFPYDPDAVEHAGEQRVTVDTDGLTLSIPRGIDNGKPIAPIDGVLVVEERLGSDTVRQAFLVEASVGTVAPPAAAGGAVLGGLTSGSIGLAQAGLLALAGGLLLNLMPCVFPVLFIKALGIARLGTSHRREVRLHGLAYTAGVLATFGLLAGALVALQQSGAVIGWGFQLQHPAVILLLAYLMVVIGLNLAGVFSVAGGANLGADLAARPGHAGAFFTGALAVIVATPCTAPFMGVALGFAVTQPPPVAIGIFLALGLGMALPFLLLSLFPGVARLLPKPGAWMEAFKQFLAFPMFATAAWLVWVLAQQAGPTGVIAALGGMILIAFGAWLWNLAPRGAGRIVSRAVGSLRADGKAVLVNLTAAWCITCQVNERLALSSAAVGAALAHGGIVALKGDWTNGDPVITRYLAEFGRNGVPLYVLYPADRGGTPMVLPQLLTEAIVLEAIVGLTATTNGDART